MNPSARLFNCARCHCQVIICRRCDRGQVYCADGCADLARIASGRRAGKRYSTTRRGRHNNAERQRRFRVRQQDKVTHQGSDLRVALALLLSTVRRQVRHPQHAYPATLRCHICHNPCDPFLRRHFLRPPERGRPHPVLPLQPRTEGDSSDYG